jgi:hypothetical protein
LRRFEVAVRLRHVGQVVALVDADLHLTAADHREQVVGHGLRGLARGDVREQRGAREVQRALGAEDAGRERRHRPRGIAEAGQQPNGRRQFRLPSKVSLPMLS